MLATGRDENKIKLLRDNFRYCPIVKSVRDAIKVMIQMM